MNTPCDICGDPRHDYRNCTKEAYRESQDVRQSPASERISGGQCVGRGFIQFGSGQGKEATKQIL